MELSEATRVEGMRRCCFFAYYSSGKILGWRLKGRKEYNEKENR